MHQARRARPKPMIEPMSDRGQGPKESQDQVAVGPPREHSVVHELARRLGISVGEMKQVELRGHEPRNSGLGPKQQLEQEIICDEPGEERRTRQQDAQQHQPRTDALSTREPRGERRR